LLNENSALALKAFASIDLIGNWRDCMFGFFKKKTEIKAQIEKHSENIRQVNAPFYAHATMFATAATELVKQNIIQIPGYTKIRLCIRSNILNIVF
jgi:hypothetical protein